MGLQTSNAQRPAYQSEERLDLRLRPQHIGVNCSIYSARMRCRSSLQFQVSRLILLVIPPVNVRQNSMRAFACSGSIFAYSTADTHDVQIMPTMSKSVPMSPAKKNSSGYGSPDNQSLTL